MEEKNYDGFKERYDQDEVPWDHELPPPEVIDLVAKLSPGRALDLGCGYGRSAIYLAQHGWTADGVDFIAKAVAWATVRAREASVAQSTRFFQGSVADLSFLDDPYDLAIDVGCMHALSDEGRIGYRDGLKRLLTDGATFLLFAQLRGEQDEGEDGGPNGILETAVSTLFADGFTVERVERGATKMPDKPAWESAWFWFRRERKG